MVRTGLEALLRDGATALRGKTIGLICNQASIGPRFEHVVDLIAAQRLVRIGALLGPEHGVRGEAQDMIAVEKGGAGGEVDSVTGAPVFSLYGDSYASLSPSPDMYDGLDAIVFDMQDVGARYYTFYATMVLAMKVAADEGLEFIVLDRPNPLGGIQIEGGVQEEGFGSFVGLFPMPVRHGLTVGELALYANETLNIDCDLTVVAMDGWKRSMLWEDTGLPFVPPSPNMPTPDTARVYPGMCLVEGTNLSEGRGTTRPFEFIGAPFLDAQVFAKQLNDQELAGVHFRPVHFQPTFHKHAGRDCGGVFVHVTDKHAFQPYRAGLALIRTARIIGADGFKWRTEKYEFVDDKPAFDLLVGTNVVREAFDVGLPIPDLFEAWKEQEDMWREKRQGFLLYE